MTFAICHGEVCMSRDLPSYAVIGTAIEHSGNRNGNFHEEMKQIMQVYHEKSLFSWNP